MPIEFTKEEKKNAKSGRVSGKQEPVNRPRLMEGSQFELPRYLEGQGNDSANYWYGYDPSTNTSRPSYDPTADTTSPTSSGYLGGGYYETDLDRWRAFADRYKAYSDQQMAKEREKAANTEGYLGGGYYAKDSDRYKVYADRKQKKDREKRENTEGYLGGGYYDNDLDKFNAYRNTWNNTQYYESDVDRLNAAEEGWTTRTVGALASQLTSGAAGFIDAGRIVLNSMARQEAKEILSNDGGSYYDPLTQGTYAMPKLTDSERTELLKASKGEPIEQGKLASELFDLADKMGEVTQEKGQNVGKVGTWTSDLVATTLAQIPQMAIAAAAGAVTGGLGAAPKVIEIAQKIGSLGYMAASVFGSSYNEGVKQGLTPEQATTRASIVSLTEVATESMWDVNKLYGGGGFDDALEKAIFNKVSDPVNMYIWLQVAGGLTEGIEEGVSSVVGNLVDAHYFDKYADYTGGEQFAEMVADAWTDFCMGVASAVLLSGATGQYSRAGFEAWRTELIENYENMSVEDRAKANEVAAKQNGITVEEAEQLINLKLSELKAYDRAMANVQSGKVAKGIEIKTDDQAEQEQLATEREQNVEQMSEAVSDIMVNKDIENQALLESAGVDLEQRTVETEKKANEKLAESVVDVQQTTDAEGNIKEHIVMKDGSLWEVNRYKGDFSDISETQRSRLAKVMETKARLKGSPEVVLVESLPMGANGVYANGKVYIDVHSKQLATRIYFHEMTHNNASAKSFSEFKNYALEQMARLKGDGWNDYYNAVVDSYKEAYDSNKESFNDLIEEELAARYVEEYLFKTQAEVDAFVRRNGNLAQRIWQSIKDFLGNKNFDEIARAEKMFAKAFSETKNTTESDSNSRFSMSDAERKQMYERKQRYVDNLNERNSRVESLTSDQHDALANTARLRHNFHTNYDSYWTGNYWGDLLNDINDGLEEAGLEPIDFPDAADIPTADDYYYVLTDAERDEYDLLAEENGYDGGFEYWREESGAYEDFYNAMEGINKTIEKYLGDIDAEHGTKYAPTGIARSRFSIPTSTTTDNLGNKLTENQQKYFANSQVRDSKGNLLRMYHGTSNYGFTLFDYGSMKFGLFGEGFYFTDDRNVADGYTRKGKGGNPGVYETYLNITNACDMDAPLDNETVTKWYDAINEMGEDGDLFLQFVEEESAEHNTTETLFRALKDVLQYEEVYSYDAGEIVQSVLRAMGYDGITHVGGGRYGDNTNNHRVYIAFDSEQIKSVDNTNPTANPDIRYSLNNDIFGDNLESRGRGYIGKSMSVNAASAYDNGEKPWTKWSKGDIVAELQDINPDVDFSKLSLDTLKKYFLKQNGWHHTGAMYNKTDFFGINSDRASNITQEDVDWLAERKTSEPKAKRDTSLDSQIDETYQKVQTILNAGTSGVKTETGLLNRVKSGKGIEAEYQKALDYIREKEGARVEAWKKLPADHSRWNDVNLFESDFNEYVRQNYADKKLSRNSSIFKDLARHFSQNSDTAKFSLPSNTVTEDNLGNKLTEKQQKYFADCKLRDENGRLLHMYHGTARADRVGTVFRSDRATSGPMAFFTSSKEIAENYSRDKADTSLAYDEEYADYFTQFRVNKGGKSISVVDLWKSLSASQKAKVLEAGKHITIDDDGSIIYDRNESRGLGNFDSYLLRENRGNGLKALVSSWLEDGNLYGEESKFIDVLSLAGINDVEYRDPYARHEDVYDVYLNITNPFDAEGVTEDFVNAFEKWASEQDPTKYAREKNYADMWDKNNVSIEQFIERLRDDVAEGTSRAWTSIPDIATDYLKSLGYDGIVDKGGKYGGSGHLVAIPFYSEQIKSVDNKNPTTDADIRFSIGNNIIEDQLEFNPTLAKRLGANNSVYTLGFDWIPTITTKNGKELSASKIANDLYQRVVNGQAPIDALSKDAAAFVQKVRSSGGIVQTIAENQLVGAHGEVTGEPNYKSVFLDAVPEAEREDFDTFRQHLHNIDRMSFEDAQALENAQNEYNQFVAEHPEYERYNDEYLNELAASDYEEAEAAQDTSSNADPELVKEIRASVKKDINKINTSSFKMYGWNVYFTSWISSDGGRITIRNGEQKESKILSNARYLTKEERLNKAAEFIAETISGAENTTQTNENTAAPTTNLAQEYLDLRKAVEDLEEAKNKPVISKEQNGERVPYTADESRKIVAEMSEEHPEWMDIVKQQNEWWDKFNRMWLVDTGLVSEEKYNELRERYPNYMPTYREEGKNGTGAGASGNVFNTNAIRQAKGSLEKALPYYQQYIEQMQRTVTLALRNQLGQVLVDYATNNALLSEAQGVSIAKDSTKNVSEILETMDNISETEKEGLKELKNGSYQMVVRTADGKVVTLNLNKEMFNALNWLTRKNNEPIAMICDMMSKVSAPIKTWITGRNPLFIISNFYRDMQTYLVNSSAPTTGEALKYYGKAIAEAWKKGDIYNELKAMGGLNEGYFSTESVYTLEEKKGFLRNLPVVKQVADAFGYVVNTIEDASQFIETLPRLAEYMILKDQGESLEVAALGAADVTTNFSRSGPIGKAINGWVLYWNAGMQGLDKTVRQVKKNPGGTLAKAMVSQMIVSAILSAINGKNPYYDDEDQSVKDAYFLIPNYLGERDGIWAKTFIKIPRSREWGVLLGASLDRLINGIMDGNVNIDTFSGLAGETISNLMPPDIGGNTMLDMWSRRALFNRNDPGKTWYGGDIVPYRLQNLSPNEQHDVQTSNAATWLAQGFNKLFNTYGGNAELSPEKVDDLIDTYGGYLGDLLQAGTSPKNQGKNFVETGLNTLKSVTVDPFIRRFTTDPRYSSGLVNQFYDDWSAAQEAYNNNKAGVKLTKKQEELLKDYKRLQAINKELSSLYKRERAMYGEKDSAANKSKKSKDYREQINDILRDYYYD